MDRSGTYFLRPYRMTEAMVYHIVKCRKLETPETMEGGKWYSLVAKGLVHPSA